MALSATQYTKKKYDRPSTLFLELYKRDTKHLVAYKMDGNGGRKGPGRMVRGQVNVGSPGVNYRVGPQKGMNYTRKTKGNQRVSRPTLARRICPTCFQYTGLQCFPAPKITMSFAVLRPRPQPRPRPAAAVASPPRGVGVRAPCAAGTSPAAAHCAPRGRAPPPGASVRICVSARSPEPEKTSAHVSEREPGGRGGGALSTTPSTQLHAHAQDGHQLRTIGIGGLGSKHAAYARSRGMPV